MLKLYQIGQTKSQSVIALSHISANVLFPTAIQFFPYSCCQSWQLLEKHVRARFVALF
jgi:hypothetical protein